jgi:hypothetical protein
MVQLIEGETRYCINYANSGNVLNPSDKVNEHSLGWHVRVPERNQSVQMEVS